MRNEPQIRVKLTQPITVELQPEIVTTIVTQYLNRRLCINSGADRDVPADSSELAATILRESLRVESGPLPHEQALAPKNPRPRAARLTGAYLGQPADFNLKPALISAQVQEKIDRVLAMTGQERAQHYSGALRLHLYTHEVYRWFATLRTTVVGYPVRRYFPDLPAAVTWLEVVRERWEQNNILHNIPHGGVSRDSFRMPCQSQSDQRGRASVAIIGKNGWTAERRARLSGAKQSQKAYRSVTLSRKEGAVRPPTNAREILGPFAAPIPGNNIATALACGSTAATGTQADAPV